MIARTMLRFLTLGLAATVFCVGPSAAQDNPNRSISNIAGDLYRFQNNYHYSVFLVTPDGIIVTDPIDANAAKWLKDELQKRFARPVKYLIYSHDHADHSSGGDVFADTATVIAHERAKTAIVGEKRPTAVPDITFSESLTLELGGKTVELEYVGLSHSDNMIVMNFPAERALFAVDIIPVRSVAWKNLTDAYIPEWIDAVKTVEGMDFDILVPGHGAMGDMSDVTAFRQYMEKLYDTVLTGVRDGRTLEELQTSIKMDEYKDWDNFDSQLALNIEGMYMQIQMHRRGN